MRITKYNIEQCQLSLVKENSVNYSGSIEMNSPSDVARLIEDMFRASLLPEEHLYLVCVNTKGRVSGLFEVSAGDLSSSLASPRSIFSRALLANAAAIFLAHNHPSGNIEPSKDDIATTRRIVDCGELMGIKLLDHIICGGGEYKSLKREGVIA